MSTPDQVAVSDGTAAAARATDGRPGIGARLATAWNRMVASPRFQQAVHALPLSRPIALRRSKAVFDICAGFVYTQTAVALLELGVVGRLAEAPRTVGALSDDLAIPRQRLRGLLDAAASLDLVRRHRGGWYTLGKYGAPLSGSGHLVSVFRHNRVLYDDLRSPLEVLRSGAAGTGLARYWPYAGAADPGGLSDEEVAHYSEFMADSQPMIAEAVLATNSFDSVDEVLDIGGGEGAFLEAVGRAYPSVGLRLLDLPAVARRAQARFSRLGWDGRARAQGGDFLRDPLPRCSGRITLIRVLHDLDDGPAFDLLRRIRGALEPGGSLLIAEPMAGMKGARRVADAYFFWYLTALGSGRPRTPAEIRRLLIKAGFRSVTRPVTRNPVIAVSMTARP